MPPEQPETTPLAVETVTTRDGRDLHLRRGGEGTPAVVFEAAMGTSSAMWGAVLPLVAARTGVAAYDRSGLGRSPADPAPRPLSRLTDDLIDVLDHLGPGPFVLVGHSWGGPIVRAAAPRLGGRLAGLVLVDQTDEGCDLFFSKGNQRQATASKVLLPAAARLGLVRMGVDRQARALPEPAASDLRRHDGTPASVRALLAELGPSTDDLRRLRDEPPEVPDVPVTVISGTVLTWVERRRRPELVEAHRRRAESHPQGRHVTADGSTHHVPFTEPDLVASEILRIVDAASDTTTPTETPS